MLIKTVLNRVHRIKGFVYEKVRFDDGEVEVEVREGKGEAGGRRPLPPRCRDGVDSPYLPA